MSDVSEIGVWILILIFAWSGLAKQRGTDEAAAAVASFGIVRYPGRVLARAVSLIELGIASGLAWTVVSEQLAPRLGFLAAAALLFGGFSLLIARSLTRGDRFACHCFGASTEPLSIWTFLRALLLTSLSLALLVRRDVFAATTSELSMEATVAAGVIGVVVCANLLHRVTALGAPDFAGGIYDRT